MSADDAARLLLDAQVRLQQGDYAGALALCERALEARVDEPTGERLQRVLRQVESQAPAALAEQARSLARRTGAGRRGREARPPRAAATDDGAGTARMLAAARELITPELVRMLRDMAAEEEPAREAADDAPAALPVGRVLARLLSADLDLARTLDLALDLTLEATGARRGFIVLRDEAGRFTVERGHGLAAGELPEEVSRAVIDEACRTRRPVISHDAGIDERFSDRESVIAAGLRSTACVPIVDPGAAGGVLGAIYLDDATRAGRFGEQASALLAELSSLIARPIANARRFDAERRALASARARLREAGVEDQAAAPARLVGRSAAIREVLALAARAGREQVPVLIEGESGTGKELLARLIHEQSPRAAGPFVAENCGAIADTLLEAELFGVTKGAFTGADRDRDGLFRLAQGGTLFLDEIAEMSPACQKKLLRVLQEREVRPVGGAAPVPVDVRVVAASHGALAELVAQGRFREDLYYRLNVVRLRLPPLRERREDIPPLIDHLLERIAAERGEPAPALSQPTLARLACHDWPGNVRELHNTLWRICIAGEEAAARLGETLAPAAGPAPPAPDAPIAIDLRDAAITLREARAEFERQLFTAVLAHHDGNITRAAASLGVGRSHLSRLLKKLGVAARED